MIVWDLLYYKKLFFMYMGYIVNIFFVKFLFYVGDCILIMGVVDFKVYVYDLMVKEIIYMFGDYINWVKCIVIVFMWFNMFWSVVEDGFIC